MHDAVFGVHQAVVTPPGSGPAQPAPDGDDDEADDRHADGHGQEDQPEQETQGENADAEQNQPEAGQWARRRLIESLPWILHVSSDPVSETVFLCAADELTEGRFREFQIEHDGEPTWLIVTRQEGRPCAWLNVCPHQGRPLNFAPDRFLTDEENRLVCAHHGAVFEPSSGVCIAGPCKNAALREVPIDESEGRILAGLPGY